MQVIDDISKLKPGLSGIMRVKNDGSLIAAAVCSCVESLDELIIVYNDCTDNSEEVILSLQARFPDKIRAFAYPYRVLSTGLTQEEFLQAQALPDDSPQLLCNYYNFALSKVSCRYAMKIDADQIYFPDELKYWAALCRKGRLELPLWKKIVGSLVDWYLIRMRRLTWKRQKAMNFTCSRLARPFAKVFREHSAYRMLKGSATISLSGLNVCNDGARWLVPLGGIDGDFKLLGPFNGEGDHLIFKMTPSVRYERYLCPGYGFDASYSLIEIFRGARRARFCGFGWFHVTAMRPQMKPYVDKMAAEQPERFVPLDEFFDMPYSAICARADKDIYKLGLRTYFNWTYKVYGHQLKDNLECLRSL